MQIVSRIEWSRCACKMFNPSSCWSTVRKWVWISTLKSQLLKLDRDHPQTNKSFEGNQNAKIVFNLFLNSCVDWTPQSELRSWQRVKQHLKPQEQNKETEKNKTKPRATLYCSRHCGNFGKWGNRKESRSSQSIWWPISEGQKNRKHPKKMASAIAEKKRKVLHRASTFEYHSHQGSKAAVSVAGSIQTKDDTFHVSIFMRSLHTMGAQRLFVGRNSTHEPQGAHGDKWSTSHQDILEHGPGPSPVFGHLWHERWAKCLFQAPVLFAENPLCGWTRRKTNCFQLLRSELHSFFANQKSDTTKNQGNGGVDGIVSNLSYQQI